MMKKLGVFALPVFCIALSLAACSSSSSSTPLADRTISGVVSGVTVSNLILQNNGADDLLITAGSTTFAFTAKVTDLAGYDVTVLSHPSTSTDYEACVVTNGSGQVNFADVTNVLVTCTTSTWQTLASLPEPPAFSDFTPAGKSALYTIQSGTLRVFSFPTTSDPQGVFTALTGTTGPTGYTGFAWVGDRLFALAGTSVYVYDINGDSWTTPVTALTYTHQSAQTTYDDSGFIYSMASNTNHLLKLNTANLSYEYITAPVNVIYSEPRAVWDNRSKRVYLSDYAEVNDYYAFNPADGSFTTLAAFPDVAGMSDAFCSDRRGHIYTVNSGGSTEIWMYTAATNTWELIAPLPFTHSDGESCTVSADGWLYYGSYTRDFARLKIF